MKKKENNNLKIAQVTHHYLPYIGGIEFYVFRLNRDLKKTKNSSIVITTDSDTSIENRKEEAIYFKTSFAFMRNPFSLDLARHFMKNEYDIIHLHNVWFLPHFEAALLRKNAKIITTLHGVYPDEVSPIVRLFLTLYKPIAKYILNKSNRVIALSNSEKEKAVKIFNINPNKIVVIPNGIDTYTYKKVKKDKVILFTGRIISDKNPDLLIKSLPYLKKDNLSFKVLFVGPIKEDYKNELFSLAKSLRVEDSIEFIKPLSPNEQKKELMDLYNKSSVFISVGSCEGLPTRLMEAMQFEVPCIAYSAGGTSELIIDNNNGFVINKLNEKMLAEKISNVLKDKKNALRIGKNARNTVLNGFEWKKISKKIQNLYEEVIKE